MILSLSPADGRNSLTDAVLSPGRGLPSRRLIFLSSSAPLSGDFVLWPLLFRPFFLIDGVASFLGV